MKIELYLLLSLILAATFGCQKADLSGVENLRNNEIGIIGHGGMGFYSANVNLPPNSEESILKAVEGYQVEAVEVDVQMSADSILFLYHDDRLQTMTDCLGCLYQKQASELEDCKYVLGFNTQHFNNQKLLRLEVIMERFSQRVPKPLIFLDLKTSPDCPNTFDQSGFESAFLKSIVELFELYYLEDWVILESADLSFLQRLKIALPAAKLSYSVAIDELAIENAVENELWGMYSNFDQTTKASIRTAHNAGLFVSLGILKIRRDAIEMIEMSPDFIYTDNIPLLQSILR